MYDYGYIIVASWLVLMAAWVLGAFTAKPDVSSSPRVIVWLRSIILLGLLIFVLRNLYADAFVLNQRFFNFGLMVDWVGAFLTVAGITLAIWAHYRLGRNWGSDTKEYPVLVTTGPYAYIRHPIYAGTILALLGSALTGSIVAVLYFIISIIFCMYRINKEESVMLGLFPEQYPTYKSHTKWLIPFIW